MINRIPNMGGEPLRKAAILWGEKPPESLRGGQAVPEGEPWEARGRLLAPSSSSSRYLHLHFVFSKNDLRRR